MRDCIIFDEIDGKQTFYRTAAVKECPHVALGGGHPHELVSDKIRVVG